MVEIGRSIYKHRALSASLLLSQRLCKRFKISLSEMYAALLRLKRLPIEMAVPFQKRIYIERKHANEKK